MALANKIDPAELVLVSMNEAGLCPWARNPRKGGFPAAVGLFQFTHTSNESTGLTEVQRQRFNMLSAEQQMPTIRHYWDFVNEHYRKPRGFDGFAGIGAGYFYAFNAAPSKVGNGSSGTVLYDRDNDKDQYGRPDPSNYNGNKGLDGADGSPKDGRITIGELSAALRGQQRSPLYGYAIECLARARARRSSPPPMLPPVFPGARPVPPQTPPAPTTTEGKRSGLGALGMLGLFWFFLEL